MKEKDKRKCENRKIYKEKNATSEDCSVDSFLGLSGIDSKMWENGHRLESREINMDYDIEIQDFVWYWWEEQISRHAYQWINC